MKDGLRIEAASSIVALDMMQKHIAAFHFAIRADRHAAQTTVAAYTEGLAAVMALVIAGRHGSRDEVVKLTTDRLAEEVDKVLTAIRAQ